MDPTTIAALASTASKLLAPAVANGGMPPPVPQRADGYSLGGMLDGRSTNATTSGAYGGAFSQANIDGSNWTVSTGRSQATGGGTSGGNGGLSPTQTNSQGGLSTPSPLSFDGLATGGANSGLLLVGLVVLAYLIMNR
ncbi:MAG: hypothetical protein ACJ8LG_21635 [Massilia sp.]